MKNAGLFVATALFSAALLFPSAQPAIASSSQFLAGVYNETGSTSIAWYIVSKSGSPLVAANVSAGSNISWIVLHPSLAVAYAIQESHVGLIGAYAIDAATYSMSALGDAQSSGGNYPVHASVHASGRFLFVANYGGNVAVLPLQADGALLPPVQTLDTGYFAHCVVVSPLSRDHVFVVSLADDAVNQYVFDQPSARLSPNPFGARMSLPPGTGPRHLLIHPLHPMAFATDEGNGTTAALVSVCAYDVAHGTLSLLRSRSALPQGADARGMFPSELILSKDARFLYVSIRDAAGLNDCIAIFSVLPASSDLVLLANVPVCWCPRSITLVQAGADVFLVVGCQTGRNIDTFFVDRETGLLTLAARAVATSNPVAFVGALQRPSLAR
jgi:6-phosphogluconolactonase